MINCERCKGEQATVHLTSIENGKKREAHLCGECANVYGADALSMSLSQLLAKDPPKKKTTMIRRSPRQRKDACPECGITLAKIRDIHRLGCPNDYEFFGSDILKVLDQYHGSTEHKGKRPGMSERSKKEAELGRLLKYLDELVKQEKYEEAAKLRDRIRQLEKELAK